MMWFKVLIVKKDKVIHTSRTNTFQKKHPKKQLS